MALFPAGRGSQLPAASFTVTARKGRKYPIPYGSSLPEMTRQRRLFRVPELPGTF